MTPEQCARKTIEQILETIKNSKIIPEEQLISKNGIEIGVLYTMVRQDYIDKLRTVADAARVVMEYDCDGGGFLKLKKALKALDEK